MIFVSCPGCGARVKDLPGQPHPYIGATAGCWEIYGQVLAKEYGEYGYPEPTHHLTVDTYAVQHPGRPGRRSIQSVNLHLASLYLILEKGWSSPAVSAALQKSLKQGGYFTWLEPPMPNGHITIVDVARAPDLAAHRAAVDAWARDVWAAWSLHQKRVNKYVDDFLV